MPDHARPPGTSHDAGNRMTKVTVNGRLLTAKELRALRDALRVACASYHADANVWAGHRAAIEAGERLAMVARGAKGIQACIRMIDQLHELEAQAAELLEEMT